MRIMFPIVAITLVLSVYGVAGTTRNYEFNVRVSFDAIYRRSLL